MQIQTMLDISNPDEASILIKHTKLHQSPMTQRKELEEDHYGLLEETQCGRYCGP